MTIEQTVEIPANHRLHLDLSLPESLPHGEATITLSIKPAAQTAKTFTGSLGNLYGCLENSPHYGGDGMEIQQKIREDAW
jgi:hypothetical protein